MSFLFGCKTRNELLFEYKTKLKNLQERKLRATRLENRFLLLSGIFTHQSN